MEDYKDINCILELMPQPVFCVRNGAILFGNQAARQLYLEPGFPVSELLGDALQDYRDFQGSSMYLQLALPGLSLGACVTRMKDLDIFVTDQEHGELQALALAAMKFREPLTEVLLVLNKDGEGMEPASRGRMSQRLFQMQRLIFNMSDAARYTTQLSQRTGLMNISAVVGDLLQRISDLTARKGVTLVHSCPDQRIMTELDTEKLERAVYNMVSNALKVTAPGGTIEAKLTCVNRRLHLSVRDYGPGIPSQVMGTLYTRYLRQPSLDQADEGMGLGMTLIRATAVAHGGAVLIDHPDQVGTRVTMTFSIRESKEAILRSNIKTMDYAGEQDHGLVEFADVLPLEAFIKD